jgi:hypothetical protein
VRHDGFSAVSVEILLLFETIDGLEEPIHPGRSKLPWLRYSKRRMLSRSMRNVGGGSQP